jgi:hypothetical protein
MDLRAAVRLTVQLQAQLLLDPWVGSTDVVSEVPSALIEGVVEDLSRGGLFLRTQAAIAVGVAGLLRLRLPEDALEVRGEVVRVERGARCGLGLRFVGASASHRTLANLLMQCHATFGFPMRAHGD